MLDMNTNPDRSRRDVTVSASPSPTPPENSSAVAVADKPRVGRKTTSTQASGSMRTGRWTLDEKLLFLYGLRMYGKGRWKKISVYLPNRSLVQIKSHAQKVIKRFDNGEDVFLRLDENMIRTEAAVAQIHEHLKNEGIPIPPGQPNGGVRQTKKPRMVEVREQIVAASALCQLAQPTPSLLESLPSYALSGDSKAIRDVVLGSSCPSSHVVKL
mmetsp:Transcript_19160/g.36275  ORF Transcript_19160/g.36275 Transcript_19160/m.36275 type:complete len:213 (-) Transcript_19160:67-705(-)